MVGLSEYIKNNETGLLYKYDDISQLKENMERLLNNPDFTKKLGKEAKKFAEKEFSKDRYYVEINKIYKMLIYDQ